MLPQHHPQVDLHSGEMDTTFPTPTQRNDNPQAYGLLMTSAAIVALGLSLLAVGAMLLLLGVWPVGVPVACAGVGLLR